MTMVSTAVRSPHLFLAHVHHFPNYPIHPAPIPVFQCSPYPAVPV